MEHPPCGRPVCDDRAPPEEQNAITWLTQEVGLGEAAARYYAEEHGLSVLCLRIGTLNRADRPSAARHFATLLTHADMVSLVRCCIEAPPDLTFGVFYGVSANRWRIWDVERRQVHLAGGIVEDAQLDGFGRQRRSDVGGVRGADAEQDA